MSVSIVVLTAIAGFAVDLGNWYLSSDHVQKAADAASLAGAPYLPGAQTKAFAAATELLEQNGFDASDIKTATDSPTDPWGPNAVTAYDKTAYIQPDPAHPTQLLVTTHVKVHNIFLGLIGIHDEYMTRTADGTYRSPIELGSPGNVLGSEPAAPNCTYNCTVQADPSQTVNGAYWLNITGGQTDKSTGDRYTAADCTVGTDDNCNADGTNPEVGSGTDGTRAHQYIVRVPANVSGPVTLQVFDGAYVDEGNHCDTSDDDTHDFGPALETGILASLNSTYAAGPNAYCTGDYDQGYGTTPPVLTFKVNKADENYKPTSAVGSPVTFPGYVAPYGDTPTQAANYLKSKLQASGGNNMLAKSWRQWYTIYQFNSPGVYVVTATTPANSNGANRFSLRLGVGTPGGWDTSQANKISLFAKHDLTVYTNAVSNDTSFYFAKIPNNAAGRSMTFELYDIGDVSADNSVDLQLVPPAGATGFGADGFGQCNITGPGSLSSSPFNCEITGATPALYNGKVVTITVQVPTSYSCDDTTPTGCWMTLRNIVQGDAVTPAQPSSDTTTWQVDDCGNPDRLLAPGASDSSCTANADD